MARFFSVTDAPPYLSSCIMYERQAVTDLWNKLLEVSKKQWKWRNVANKQDASWLLYRTNKRMLQIYGPPGSGKSSATFFWVREVCKIVNTVQCIWINCGEGGCWKMGMNTSEDRVDVEEHEIPRLDSSYFNHIAVFDGIQASTIQTWLGLMNDMARKGVVVIAVSSEGVRFHAGESQDIVKFEHFFPSWIKTEYYASCSDDFFWQNVCLYVGGNDNDQIIERTRLINAKFEIAGHSAHFMFSMETKEVESGISTLADSLGRDIRSLLDAVRSARSAGAVNSLVARMQEDKNGITPEYSAVFPTVEDVESVATTIEDIRASDLERDTLNFIGCIVSPFAITAIVSNFDSDVEQLRSLAQILGNKAIEGYAAEQQLKKATMKHLWR